MGENYDEASASKLHRSILKGLISVLSFGAFLGLGVYFVGRADAQALVKETGAWAPTLFILLKASTIVFAPAGGLPLYLLATTLFGFSGGVVYLIAGDMAGHLTAFWLARAFGRRVFEWLFSDDQLARIDRLLAHIATWKKFLFARLTLVGIGDLLSYAVGLTAITFAEYLAVTVGIVIMNAFVMTTIGYLFIWDRLTYVIVMCVAASIPVTTLLVQYLRKRRVLASP